MRPCKLKSDEKWKRFIGFVDFFSISDIFFNNIQISSTKIFFVTLRSLVLYYIVSQIITREVSIVKNL